MQSRKAVYNNEQQTIASTLNNLAVVYYDVGHYEQAKQGYYKALTIRQKLLGENHPDTAKSYVNLAEIYSMQAEYEKALIFYEKALLIYNNVLGEEHPHIAYIYGNIAAIYQRIGEYEKSLSYYNKALIIQKNSTVSNELISSTINVIGKNNVTNITNISEKPTSSDSLKDVIDKMTIKVLNKLKSKDKEDYELFNSKFVEIQRLIRIIKKELIFETTGDTEICHYSKLATLKHIIRNKDSKPQPKLRISNIAYLNDPSEGNVLLQLLKKSVNSNLYNLLFGSDNMEENKLSEVKFSRFFIGSFSTAKNKLPMWTLYGDDSKGCCLVFDDFFFEKENALIEEKTIKGENIISPQELTLYRVKYIDIDNLDESDTIIGYLNKIAGILNLLESIISKYEEVRTWILTLLDEIRFLFKDCDYDYESEVRIIIHAENSEIKVDDGNNELNIPKLYLDLQRELINKINCLGDYIEEMVNLNIKNKNYFQWYRGHADITWELVPKVQRGFKGEESEELFRKERYYTNDFQARASVLLSSVCPRLDEYASWLTLMQHYGLPTRLLDWSRSPLVALYFAVSDTTKSEKDACIWVLTPGKLNETEKLEKPTEVNGRKFENTFIYNMNHNTIYTMIFTAFRRWDLSDNIKAITPSDEKFDHRFKNLENKIAACYPTEANGRVYNQLAAFTVHNSLRKLENICDEFTLARVIIPCNIKRKLLDELRVCGITESYIYPDLEHLAQEINSWHTI